jgi:hypothetical protein
MQVQVCRVSVSGERCFKTAEKEMAMTARTVLRELEASTMALAGSWEEDEEKRAGRQFCCAVRRPGAGRREELTRGKKRARARTALRSTTTEEVPIRADRPRTSKWVVQRGRKKGFS